MDNRSINKDYEKTARELIETEPALEYIRDSLEDFKLIIDRFGTEWDKTE